MGKKIEEFKKELNILKENLEIMKECTDNLIRPKIELPRAPNPDAKLKIKPPKMPKQRINYKLQMRQKGY